MRAAIRADAGEGVGLGHLGRCLALGQALSHLGCRPVFLDVPSNGIPWLRCHGFKSQSWTSSRWGLLIGDSYRFTPQQFSEMRRQARTLLLFDDFGALRRPCDWVLCGRLDNPRWQSHPGAGLLLGPRFQPLRREYWLAPGSRPVSPRIERCLVTLGGGASGRLLRTVVAAASEALPEAELEVVLGPLDRFLSSLSLPKRARLHRGLSSLRPLMLKCDAAVSAGGQTLMELAAAGVPAVAVTRARNQEANIAGLAAAGTALPAGAWSQPQLQERIASHLSRLDRDRAQRSRMSEAGLRLVDGRGALRVARLLLA